MKLLIITQAVDLDDPVLGFFHRWVEEFAPRYEHVSVVCLKEGRHALPANVSVYSLGKESGASRIKYVWNFYRYIWKLRHEYDAVFVHMNQEYVLLGWKLWWLLGKRIVLWRNHRQGSVLARFACLVSHAVCYTSPEAYVAKYRNAVRMPIGIDTDFFKPTVQAPEKDSILFLGRLDEVKRADVFVDALRALQQQEVRFHADVYGSPTYADSFYANTVITRAKPLVDAGLLTFHPAVQHEKTPALYAAHSIYVNLTPSGSFDKTIGEAMACGCVVVAANAVVQSVIGDAYVSAVEPDVVAKVLALTLAKSPEERAAAGKRNRTHMEQEHSLSLLAGQLSRILAA
jgi:glycosyltransferase involved in cell wall biosynthesis